MQFPSQFLKAPDTVSSLAASGEVQNPQNSPVPVESFCKLAKEKMDYSYLNQSNYDTSGIPGMDSNMGLSCGYTDFTGNPMQSAYRYNASAAAASMRSFAAPQTPSNCAMVPTRGPRETVFPSGNLIMDNRVDSI